MVLTTVAPAAAISSAWSEAVVSWENVTMYGTEEGEGVVPAADEDVSLVAAEVSVALVSDELTADAPVSVAPVDDSPSGEMPPNAPETNRPATKTAAIPSVPLMCHACAFFFRCCVIPLRLSLLVRPPRASPDTPRPPGSARRPDQARIDQLAAEIPLR